MNKVIPALSIAFLLSSAQQAGAQCAPQLIECTPPQVVCDSSNNNPAYWNEIYWWENDLQTHDLPEGPVDLSLMLLDSCQSGAGFQVQALLFLDLDYNGTQETVVNSNDQNLYNAVRYNNALTPNYSGGTLRSFDKRNVPSNQHWGFKLSSSTVGDTAVHKLAWANQSAPDVFVTPELPHGAHRIVWHVTDSSGNTYTCERSFVVKDCKPPSIECLNGLMVNLLPTQQITIRDTDFLKTVEDNVTPASLISTAIRKSGTGTGFPTENGNPVTQVTFTCAELGEQTVELWAKDRAGNTSYCETPLSVQDGFGHCDGTANVIQACAQSVCSNFPVPVESSFEFKVYFGPFDPIFTFFSFGNCGKLDLDVPPNGTITVTPKSDANPLQGGVTLYDLGLLEQYLQGTYTFSSPYQWIAADANNDKVIDSLDVIECRRLLLGIYTELPHNSSWRFVDKSYAFPSPDPLSAPFPESITLTQNTTDTLEFVAVKICDITCAATSSFFELKPGNAHLIGSPQPNPSSGVARFPIQMAWEESVVLELFDLSGQLLHRQSHRLGVGPTLLELPDSAMRHSGLYLWRVQVGDVVTAGKLVRN
jgi:hypothetical protein